MTQKNKKEKGIALLTAIAIIFILALLGMNLMFLLRNDTGFVQKDTNNDKAYYLAKAGLEWLAVNSGTPLPIEVQVDDPRHCFIIKRVGSDIVSTGTIKNFIGNVVAERALKAPEGDPTGGKFNDENLQKF